MVPKLHAKGSNFKGAAQYLLHDKGRARSSERVAWTETRNLAVDDPETAWRIMAATAINQARLKEQAGVKNTGRKSDKHVLHFTLAWHPDQSPTREEMSQAADEAIKALGGSDRQAIVIAHDDEKHAHVHIMLNRVSPVDGRHLSSSKEKLKLSEWAQDYEERTGIFCENRIINNAMRNGGEYVRGQKDQARHIFEAQCGAASNDNDLKQVVAEEQRKKDAALAMNGRNLTRLQGAAWSKLAEAHKERKAALARDLQRQINAKRHDTREEYRPKWRALNEHQRSERETFEELEKSFFGRTSNIAKTVQLSRGDIGGEKSNVISRSFRILTNAGARREYFDRAQERARIAVQREQAQRVQAATQELRASQELKYAQNRAVFLAERENLAQSQNTKREQLQQQWRDRSAERNAAFAAVPPKERTPKQPELTREQKILAALERSQYGRAFDRAQKPPVREQDNKQDQASGGTEGDSGSGDRSPARKQQRVKPSRAQGRGKPDRER